jgi:hypothetical protein
MCLKPGVEWKEGFCAGLMNSRTFCPLLSKPAISNKEVSYQNFANLKKDSRCDNVYLEHRLALELRGLGLIEQVFPMLIGDLNDDVYGVFTEADFPECPDCGVDAVEEDVMLHMQRQALGSPQIPNRPVSAVMKEMRSLDVLKVVGERNQAWAQALGSLHTKFMQNVESSGSIDTVEVISNGSTEYLPLTKAGTDLSAPKGSSSGAGGEAEKAASTSTQKLPTAKEFIALSRELMSAQEELMDLQDSLAEYNKKKNGDNQSFKNFTTPTKSAESVEKSASRVDSQRMMLTAQDDEIDQLEDEVSVLMKELEHLHAQNVEMHV